MMESGREMRIYSALFGAVTVARGEVLRLTAPLPPFFHVRRFVLLSRPEEAPFQWLQAVDEPALALAVAPYEALTAAPLPPLSPALEQELGCLPGDPPEALVVVAVGDTATETTINLLAPIYVCRQTMRARQVVLGGDLDLARVPVLAQAA